ncbi:hypothetical protein IMZ48_00955 [Candidatus Bathyarchaeota archaeon]|nr:hypothetical protein [Candidatus Bathyarchaeota archaeon]
MELLRAYELGEREKTLALEAPVENFGARDLMAPTDGHWEVWTNSGSREDGVFFFDDQTMHLPNMIRRLLERSNPNSTAIGKSQPK